MIEIIPNWHPVLVHFSVALLTIAPALMLIAAWLPPESRMHSNLVTVVRWNLVLGFIITLGTVAAGWYAFNTVAHDDAAHEAMQRHRNGALLTVALYLPLVLWSIAQARRNRTHGLGYALSLIVPMLALLLTAWRGGELVYRHGLGVMSLPNVESGHHHQGATREHSESQAPPHEHSDAAAEHSHDYESEAPHEDGEGDDL